MEIYSVIVTLIALVVGDAILAGLCWTFDTKINILIQCLLHKRYDDHAQQLVCWVRRSYMLVQFSAINLVFTCTYLIYVIVTQTYINQILLSLIVCIAIISCGLFFVHAALHIWKRNNQSVVNAMPSEGNKK